MTKKQCPNCADLEAACAAYRQFLETEMFQEQWRAENLGTTASALNYRKLEEWLRENKEPGGAFLAEYRRIERILIISDFVATHWHQAYMANLQAGHTEYSIGTHPLSLVLAALGGEDNPVMLGIAGNSIGKFRAAAKAAKEKEA